MYTHSNKKGFTIVEIVITLALLAVFIAVGVPSFSSLIRDNRLVTDINSLVASIQLARSEAIRRGVQVTIIRTSTTSDQWENGWVVFTDQDGQGDLDDDGDAIHCEAGVDDDCVLKIHSGVSDGMTLDSGGDYDDYISYLPTGFVVGSSANAGTFTLCKQESSEAIYRQVAITTTGRPSTNKGTNSTCP